MNWSEYLGLIASILIPMICGFACLISRMDRRFEHIYEKFDQIDMRFDNINDNLNSIEQRLSRLEGRFEERGYWESRSTGTSESRK